MSEQFVDITDETSAEREERTAGVQRWVVGPPRWLFWSVLTANAALYLYAISAPHRFVGAWLVAAVGWLALGLAFVFRFGLTLAIGGRRAVLRTVLQWVVAPAVAGTLLALSVMQVPLRVGLELAKDDMLAFAADPAAAAPARVGQYRVRSAEHLAGGGAIFVLAGTGFLSAGSGFVYAPDRPVPAHPDYVKYHRLDGPWYEFVEEF